MTPQQRPHVRTNRRVRGILGSELPREGLVKALAAIHADLPFVSSEQRADRVRGRANCFCWMYNFLADGWGWGIACIVDDSGWPNNLDVVDVFVVRGSQIR